MQERTIQQMIRDHESNMPPEIMNLIKAFDWKKELRTVVNQNQLMIDVGADLEESVYLMILGVVSVGDVYERLMEVHEMPEDKARKVIEEIEALIFEPLHQQLMRLEDEDIKKEQSAPKQFASSVSNSAVDITRDDILAEIEKDPEPIVLNKPIVSDPIPTPVATQIETPFQTPAVTTGVTKPFSLSFSKEVQTAKPELEMKNVAEGVQADHITAGLGKLTVTQSTVEPVSNIPTKTYVADPYRESIE